MRSADPGLSRVKNTAAGTRVPTVGFTHSTRGAKHLGEVLYLGLDPRRQELGSGENETGRGKANKGAHGVEAVVGNGDSVPWGETSEESCRTHVASFSPLTAVPHRLRVAPEPAHLP